jgi:hypothetical protein
MAIKIENLGAIERAVGRRVERLKPAFTDAVSVEKERIKTRTQSGLDVSGKTFPRYSKKWAKVRKAEGLQTSYVDLTFSGDMFEALRVAFKSNATSITGVIAFAGSKQAEKAMENEMLGRSFFGLSKEQIEIIKTKIRNAK